MGVLASRRRGSARPAEQGAIDGDAVVLLRQFGHRYVAGIRLVTLVPTVVIALLTAGDALSGWATVAVVGVMVSWSLMYSWRLVHRPDPWITLADAAVLTCVASCSAWIVSASWLATGKSWLLPFLAFACVSYQYYASAVLGGVAALFVLTAMIAGTSMAVPAGGSFDSVHTAIWSIVLVVLGRVFWILVHRGGRRADAAMAEAAQARRDQLVAQEVRADELEHNRRLHDTAATTLLMVGLGQTRRSAAVLTAQARRDVEALSRHQTVGAVSADLVGAISAVIDLVPLVVDFQHPRELVLPSPVTQSMVGACQEALGNIVRHTSVSACRVVVAGDSNRALVEIVDEGGGFDHSGRTVTGRGLTDSIGERLAGVGGRGTVTSCPGIGTSVDLVWPYARQ